MCNIHLTYKVSTTKKEMVAFDETEVSGEIVETHKEKRASGRNKETKYFSHIMTFL